MLSMCMVPDHTYLVRSMHSNLLQSHQQRWTESLLPRKKGSRNNPQHAGRSICGFIPSFSLKIAIEAVGVKPLSVDGKLLSLPGPYLWHTIGTFNTCSRVPIPRSLTDIGGGYNLGVASFPHTTPRTFQPTVLHFPPKGPIRSQVIQSQHKPLEKVM
jgi:hypothetical protein